MVAPKRNSSSAHENSMRSTPMQIHAYIIYKQRNYAPFSNQYRRYAIASLVAANSTMTAINITSHKSLSSAQCSPAVRTSESSLSSFHPVRSLSTAGECRPSPPYPWPGPFPFPARETVRSSADWCLSLQSHSIQRKIAGRHLRHTSCRCAPLRNDGLTVQTAFLRSEYRFSLRHNR